MINKICTDTRIRMEKCVNTFKYHINKIRTSRASPSLLNGIQIEYYGTLIPLHKLANIITADAYTLVITVFDRILVPTIEKAIMASNLKLNSYSDGTVIRVPLPPLTETRRRELIKVVRTEAEQGRISIRNVRRDANDKVKELLKNKTINEDEEYNAQDNIQKITNTCIKDINKTLAEKEIDLMKI